ncbi:MAG TPA: hypothetical protein VGM86_27075 [Thermoanaerobaculia bacterium]|jgi:hypothetical protein
MAARLLSVVLLLSLALLSRPLVAEEILANQDVVKMVLAGLGEEVVIAKVKEAPRTAFHLGVDDLVELRKAGVSERVIAAMLDRNRPADQSPQAAMNKALGVSTIDVSLKTGEKTVPLSISRGERSSAGFMFGNNFMNYPGLHARVRTSEKRPALLVRSDVAPEWVHYSLGKLDVDKKNGVRSLKISSTRQDFRAGFKGGMNQAPDPDWTVPFEVTEEGEGLWRVTPRQALPPGEYGWYVHPFTTLQGGGLFDFGVD